MFLRLVQFTLSEGGRSQAQVMADDLISAIKHQPGCLSAVFFGGADGESGICVVWESQEHAEAAAGVISPRLEAHLDGNVVAPPRRGLFPVLASWSTGVEYAQAVAADVQWVKSIIPTASIRGICRVLTTQVRRPIRYMSFPHHSGLTGEEQSPPYDAWLIVGQLVSGKRHRFKTTWTTDTLVQRFRWYEFLTRKVRIYVQHHKARSGEEHYSTSISRSDGNNLSSE